MERITIQSVTSENKPKKDHTGFFDKVTVHDSLGRTLDSYDTGLCSLGAGSVIDGEVIQKGKYFNLGKAWVLVTKVAPVPATAAVAPPPPGSPAPPAPPQPNYGLDLELLKRRSIEGQQAMQEVGQWLRTPEALRGALPEQIIRITGKYWQAVENSLDHFLGETAKPNHLVHAAQQLGATLVTEPEHKPATAPGGLPNVPGVDIAFLRSLFPKLQWKSDGTAMSWIEYQFKVKRSATLEATLVALTPEQRSRFVDYVSTTAGG